MSNRGPKPVRPLKAPAPAEPSRAELAFKYRDLVEKEVMRGDVLDFETALNRQARLYHDTILQVRNVQCVASQAEHEMETITLTDDAPAKLPTRIRAMLDGARPGATEAQQMESQGGIDDEFTVVFQRPHFKGVSVTAPPPAVCWGRSIAVHGAVFELGERQDISKQRRARWSACFSAIEKIDQSLTALLADHDQDVEQDLESPPVNITERDKADVLADGMAPELEEIPLFLTTWLEGLQTKTSLVLCSLHAKRNEKIFGMSHRGVQVGLTAVPSEGDATGSSKPLTEHADARSSSASSEVARDQNTWLHNCSNAGYARIAHRYAAAIRIQAVFRGSAVRAVVGNVSRGLRTPFQARNLEIARCWTESVTLDSPNQSTKETLLAIVSVLFVGRIADVTSDATRGTVPFAEFVVTHFKNLFSEGQESRRTDALSQFVKGLQRCHRGEPSLTLVYLLMMGDFTPAGESAVQNLIAQVVLFRHPHASLLYLPLDLNRHEPGFTAAQCRAVLRKVVPADQLATIVSRVTWARNLVIPPWTSEELRVRTVDRTTLAALRQPGIPETLRSGDADFPSSVGLTEFLLIGALAAALQL